MLTDPQEHTAKAGRMAAPYTEEETTMQLMLLSHLPEPKVTKL